MNNTSQVPRLCYKKILYTTDLSEEGRQAFPHAASLARLYEAELTILHIVESQAFEKFLVGYINDALWEEIKNRDLNEAREILIKRKRKDSAIRDSVQEFHQSQSDDPAREIYVTYDIRVGTGDPVEQILAQVAAGSYDLVIMAKRGQGSVQEGPIGDTARRVIRHCPVPVMVVPVDGHIEPC